MLCNSCVVAIAAPPLPDPEGVHSPEKGNTA